MISQEAILAGKNAYDIEIACLQEMKDYFDEVQFSKAVELLITTDMQVEEISSLLNFSSTSYFRKVLYKHTGKTPREIRRTSPF